MPVSQCSIVLALLFALGGLGTSAEYFVAVTGQAENPGTRAAPWDIASALENKSIHAGDTLWILAGTYKRRPKEQFDVRLIGSVDQPIQVRGEIGQRVTIDGGLAVQDPSAHLWIRDLEIMVSEPQPSMPQSKGSNPPEFTRPWGGLHIFGGKKCKFINLVIHECRQGVSWWRGSIDSDLYGCVIYGNGWPGVDRGHGHCIYTQNKDGIKLISNNILTAQLDGQQTLQAYGSKNAFVDNYVCEDNVAYDKGRFLIGGGQPSHNIRVYRNHLYKVDMQLGYDAPTNVDCELQDNRIFRGSLVIQNFQIEIKTGNWIFKEGEKVGGKALENESFILPNKYDENRAHVIVYNWTGGKTTMIGGNEWLKGAGSLALYDPKDLYGTPQAQVEVVDGAITIPTPREFMVYVVRKSAPH